LILPGVTIGEDAVVAAGAIVASDVLPRTVVAGVPAKQISTVGEVDAKRASRKAQFFAWATYGVDDLAPDLDAELREAADRDGGYFIG
jgi:tetrahydrodipicolinate N-succinyltransferase